MSTRARTWAGGIAVVLFGLMLFLLMHGPRLTFEGGEENVRVACASVITGGWPTDGNFLADENSSAWSDHIISGSAGNGDSGNLGRQSIANGCSDARITYLGFLILLAIPTTVLTTAALVGRREPAYRELAQS